MRILSIGKMNGVSNTCVHRNNALQSCVDRVDVIDTYAPLSLSFRIRYHLFLYGLPIKLPDKVNANGQIRKAVDDFRYDVVWIDKGITIEPDTLMYIKQKAPSTKLVSYSPDTMTLRHNQSKQYIDGLKYYDVVFTTKSYAMEGLRQMGARHVYFVNNAYESTFHYPRNLTSEDRNRLGGDVGFVGMWEPERCKSILYLAEHGINVRVFGDRRWHKYKNISPNLRIEDKPLYNEDYAKSFKAFKICLCFLRKINFDLQTTRSVEIPACGGFMLGERTSEHLQLFKEGEEAEFFNDDEEMLRKCKYYLSHDVERNAIAEAGYQRCLRSGYSNNETVERMLKIVMEQK